MPAVTQQEALDLLTKTVEEDFGPDDVLEVHRELFPDETYTEEEVYEDMTPAIEEIVDHINSNLGTDELVDLWNLILPKDRDVWYDEGDHRFHFNEEESSSSLSE